jgi:hypothetical protein
MNSTATPTPRIAFRQKMKDFAASLPEAVEGAKNPNDVITWLKHGTYNGQECDTATIDDIEAPVIIWRAITKFYAVYKAVSPRCGKMAANDERKAVSRKGDARIRSARGGPGGNGDARIDDLIR